MNRSRMYPALILLMILGATACAPLPPTAAPQAQPASATVDSAPSPTSEEIATSAPASTETKAIPVTGSLMKPADNPPAPAKQIYDVQSAGKSAPYGDSYKINRFERPFLKDMTYVPDLDILSFSLGEDADWHYISIELNGNDPNKFIGINYGVEIDTNADGFGDYLIWAHRPYTTTWETGTLRVLEDTDHDSAGRSSSQADTGGNGNGYESVIFDGESNQNADPDLAWVRMLEGRAATIQFAFKKSWLGSSFMIGVLADAGLKDISKFDYNDRFQEAEAGSPVLNNPYYPVGSLYAVDNTCWQAYGAKTAAYRPKFCPTETLPTATRRPSVGGPATVAPATAEAPTSVPPPLACEPTFDPLDCGDVGYNSAICQCNSPTEPPVATDPPVVTEPPVATDPPVQPTDPPVVTDPPA